MYSFRQTFAATSHEHSHPNAGLRLYALWQGVLLQECAEDSFANAFRRDAIHVQHLPERIHPSADLRDAHAEAAPGRTVDEAGRYQGDEGDTDEEVLD